MLFDNKLRTNIKIKQKYFGVCTFYTFILILMFASLMRGQTLSGSGTLANPYQIFDADDLNDVRNYSVDESLYFQLQNNIDLSSYPNWIPINNFYNRKYHLDGQRYTISNMTITHNTTVNEEDVSLGLFGKLSNTVVAGDTPNLHDIIMSSSSITVTVDAGIGGDDVLIGLLTTGSPQASESDTASIMRIYIDSTCSINVDGDFHDWFIGGISATGTIYKCYSEAKIILNYIDGSGSETVYVGGIISNTGWVKECGWNGVIVESGSNSGANRYSGGLAGYMTSDRDISNCFSLGKFGEKLNRRGGFLGRLWNNKISDSYADIDSMAESCGHLVGNLDNLAAGDEQHEVFFERYIDNVSTSLGYYEIQSASGLDTTGTQQLLSNIKSQAFLEAHGWDFTNTWIIGNRFNGRPYLKWMDNLVPPPITQEVHITAPTDNSVIGKNDSTLITWELVQTDTVILRVGSAIGVNQRLWFSTDTIAGTSKMHTFVTSTDVGRIKVSTILNGEETTVFDERSIIVLADDAFRINSATVTGTTTVLNVDTNPGLDSLIFYVGKDTNNMSYLGKSQLKNVNDNYSFTLPLGFYAEGDYYYKVINDVDTSKAIITGKIYKLGYPRGYIENGNYTGTNTCWYDKDIYKIGINRFHDGGCRWVNNMTYQYVNYMFYTDFPDSITWQNKKRDCDSECRSEPLCKMYNCTNAYNYHKVFWKDTLTNNLDSSKVVMMSEFNISAPFELGGRRYYGVGNIIYADDLVHNIDSIIVKTLDINSNPSLALLKYKVPNDSDILKYDGSASSKTRALTELKHPKMLIIEGEYDGGWSYFNLPKQTNVLKQNIYKANGSIILYKNRFRGIDPKVKK